MNTDQPAPSNREMRLRPWEGWVLTPSTHELVCRSGPAPSLPCKAGMRLTEDKDVREPLSSVENSWRNQYFFFFF